LPCLVELGEGELGIRAARRGAQPLESDREATGMCFHGSTSLDLAWGGRKGVGSAQRRTGGRVLQHGSIKLGASRLDEGVAGVRDSAPEVELHDLARELRTAFERELGLEFELGVPDVAERSAAHQLGTRYLDPAFTRKR
jgi:lipoate-protein ligase A